MTKKLIIIALVIASIAAGAATGFCLASGSGEETAAVKSESVASPEPEAIDEMEEIELPEVVVEDDATEADAITEEDIAEMEGEIDSYTEDSVSLPLVP